MRNAKYYLYGLLALILLIFIYHFYAANQAEKQISEALQEQAQQARGAYTLSYSDLDISPFSGDVELQQLNFTFGGYIHRASLLYFDLSYLDFLRIYFGGAEYGLRNIDNMKSTLADVSVLYRPEVREIKFDTVSLNYEGDLYDLLRHTVTASPLENEHLIKGAGKTFTINQPQAPWGQIESDTVLFSSVIPPQSESFQEIDELILENSSITWTPPKEIQEKYGFFLRGFGYQTDEIPVDSAHISLSRNDTLPFMRMETDLYTDLFHAQAQSDLQINTDRWRESTFRDGILRIRGTSEEFKNFLSSAEQLFGINLSNTNGEIARFSGPLLSPHFSPASASN